MVRLYAEAGHPEVVHDAVAWCAAFVGAMLHRAGLAPTGSLMARSYETWGQVLAEPIFGCVGVKKRGTGWQGHVGFVVGATAGQIIMLGGNQGDQVCVAAFPRAEFTAFRWPDSVGILADHGALPVTVSAAVAVLRAATISPNPPAGTIDLFRNHVVGSGFPVVLQQDERGAGCATG